MARIGQSCVLFLIFLNFCLSLILAAIAGWALNYSIQNDYFIDTGVVPPREYSPVYFPMGNGATGFFVIFSLISGVVGAANALSGLTQMRSWSSDSCLSVAQSSGFTAWVLTLLRTMEAFSIILAVTQFAYIFAVHAA